MPLKPLKPSLTFCLGLLIGLLVGGTCVWWRTDPNKVSNLSSFKGTAGVASQHPEVKAKPKGAVPKPKSAISGDIGKSNLLTLPVDEFFKIVNSPYLTSLVPSVGALGRYGIPSDKATSIVKELQNFKNKLEELEFANAKLIQKPEGDYYEIAPFEFPESVLNELKLNLSSILDKEDWRVDFLIQSLKKTASSGGLGKHRQEIAIEDEKDATGRSYQMLRTKIYNANQQLINHYGFEIVASAADKPLLRHDKIFRTLKPSN